LFSTVKGSKLDAWSRLRGVLAGAGRLASPGRLATAGRLSSAARLATAGVLTTAGLLAACPAATAQSVYVANESDGAIGQYQVAANGSLSPDSPLTVSAGSNPNFILVSPNGAYVYVSNASSGTVSQYTTTASGTLAPMSPATVATGSSPLGIVLSPNGQYAYVADFKAPAISEYVVGANGALTPNPSSTSVPSANGVSQLAMSANGQYLYSTNANASAVSQYSVAANGTLSALVPATVAVTAGTPRGITLGPDRSSLYVTEANGVQRLTPGAGGALTLAGTVASGLAGQPYSIAFGANANAYVAATNSSVVDQFAVGLTGSLTADTPPTAPSGSNPRQVILSSDGTDAYTVNLGSNSISQYTVGAGGTLTPDTPTAVTVGSSPIAIAFSPGVATTLTAQASASVPLGRTITASATLGGGMSPTGTVTFNVYGPGDTTCRTSLASSTAAVSGDGSYTSPAFTPTTPGTYVWTASYGGDAGNAPSGPTPCAATGAAVAVTACGATGVLSGTGPFTCTYATTGSDEFTVPAGVTQAAFTVVGAEGGTYFIAGDAAHGGSPSGDITGRPGGGGGEAIATLGLTPGQTLQVDVAGAGANGTAASRSGGMQNGPSGGSGALGGFGGSDGGVAGAPGDASGASGGTAFNGGNGSGGGGSSDIRIDPNGCAELTCGLADRVIVGAGGGGDGGTGGQGNALGGAGGGGGGQTGADGGATVDGGGKGASGAGGTQAAGGAGGLEPALNAPGANPSDPRFGGNGLDGALGAGGAGGAGNLPCTGTQTPPCSGGQNATTSGGGAGGGAGGGDYGGGGGSGGGSAFGGGGGAGGGGAGGSSYAAPSAADVALNTGVNAGTINNGSGQVTITWSTTPVATPSLSTTAAAPTATGQLADSATLSGGDDPTGPITFNVYGPGDTTCSNSLATTTVAAAGDGTYQSALFTPHTTGTYQWVANYGGDSQNGLVSGTCGAAGESATVTLTSVYVVEDSTDAIDQFTVLGDGSLFAKSPASLSLGGQGATGVTISPDGRSLYVVSAGQFTSGTGKISQFTINADGTLSPKTPATVTAGVYPYAPLVITPDGRRAYVANEGDSTVSEYDVAADGTLSPKSPATVALPARPAGLAVSPDGQSLYVSDQLANNTPGSQPNTIAQFTINADGTLSPKTPAVVATPGAPLAIAVSPDGLSLYVTVHAALAEYTINPDGTLSPKTPASAATGANPNSIAMSTNGRNVYVGNASDGSVSQFTTTANGTLAPDTPPAVSGTYSTWGIALSADGRSAYVTDSDELLTQYSIGADGTLSPKTPATVQPPFGGSFGVATSPGPQLARTALSTQASASVVVGGQVSASATLTGGASPTGTVMFDVFGPGDTTCSTPLAMSTATVTGSGTYTAAPITATSAGTYSWIASYGGDAANSVAATACTSPTAAVLVTPASPVLSTGASGSGAVGGQVSDTATIAGGDAPSGSITFSLYGPTDPACLATPLATSVVPVTGDGSYTSSGYTPTQPGTYQWVAGYGGDANNAATAGLCGLPGESVTMTPAAPAALTVSPSTVAAGGTVNAAFSGVTLPTAADWIGVFAAGAPNTAYVSWFWSNSCTHVAGGSGVASGDCPVVMPAAGGSYQLRLFTNNSFTVLATSNTVTDAGGPPPTLTATPTTVGPGGTSAVAWSGVVAPSPRDWVGVYQTGVADSAYLAFFYTSSCTQVPATAAASGSCAFTLPTTPGTYEFRLFSDDSYDLLGTSAPVTVLAPPAPSLTAGPASVAGGGQVSIAWTNFASPSRTDWVALYQAGAPAGEYLDWFYDSSCTQTAAAATAAGTCSYSMPTTPGTYDFALMANDGNTVLATSGAVTVTGSPVTVSATPSSVGPGGLVAVAWSGVPAPSGSDWIGVYATGAADSGYAGFLYDTTCSASAGAAGVGSGSCVFTLPATDGTYEFRLFAHNTFTRLGASNAVTVTG
jgi:6-phosphogluconolactonase (cycloisomerase 2 family)